MKTFILCLTLIFTMNISLASPNNGIKAVLDEFTYQMTVEGKALDPQTAESTIEEFRGKLLAAGTREDIIETALDGMADQQKASELRTAFAQIEAQKLSPEEALALLHDVLSNGHQGASWNGITDDLRVLQIFGAVALIAVLFAGVVNSTHPN